MATLSSLDAFSVGLGGGLVLIVFIVLAVILFKKKGNGKKNKKLSFVGLREEIRLGHAGAKQAADSLKRIDDLLKGLGNAKR